MVINLNYSFHILLGGLRRDVLLCVHVHPTCSRETIGNMILVISIPPKGQVCQSRTSWCEKKQRLLWTPNVLYNYVSFFVRFFYYDIVQDQTCGFVDQIIFLSSKKECLFNFCHVSFVTFHLEGSCQVQSRRKPMLKRSKRESILAPGVWGAQRFFALPEFADCLPSKPHRYDCSILFSWFYAFFFICSGFLSKSKMRFVSSSTIPSTNYKRDPISWF